MNTMKKMMWLLLAAALLTGALAGCGNTAKEMNMDALHTELLDSSAFTDILSPLEPVVAANIYGVEAADVAQCTVLCSTGATAEEIGLFQAADEDAAKRIYEAALARVGAQEVSFENYVPAEMPKLADAIVKQAGVYVVYVVAADAKAAGDIVGKYI